MLVDQFPARLFAQDKISIGYFKVDEHIFTIADSFAHCCYKFAWLRKMFKYMATYNQICRFIRVFRRVIVGNEANIAGNVIAGLGLIARTEADTNVVPAITDDAQKVALSASNFDNTFVMQVICRDEPV